MLICEYLLYISQWQNERIIQIEEELLEECYEYEYRWACITVLKMLINNLPKFITKLISSGYSYYQAIS